MLRAETNAAIDRHVDAGVQIAPNRYQRRADIAHEFPIVACLRNLASFLRYFDRVPQQRFIVDVHMMQPSPYDSPADGVFDLRRQTRAIKQAPYFFQQRRDADRLTLKAIETGIGNKALLLIHDRGSDGNHRN